jgi:hypothetical protein
MRASRRNSQYSNDVVATSLHPPHPTLALKTHNQNNNALRILSSFFIYHGMPPFIGFERLKFLGYILN